MKALLISTQKLIYLYLYTSSNMIDMNWQTNRIFVAFKGTIAQRNSHKLLIQNCLMKICVDGRLKSYQNESGIMRHM